MDASSSSESQTELKQVVNETIAGLDLRRREFEMINKLIGFEAGEEIEIIYRDGGHFEKYFDMMDSILVGITNQRIFKIEKGIAYSAKIKDMKRCSHKKTNPFQWDAVEVEMNDGKKMLFGIYWGETTAHFTALLGTKISDFQFKIQPPKT